jgi:hypothetical protein
MLLAEKGGFEPPVRFKAYDSLANCWFKPLTHLSGQKLKALMSFPSDEQQKYAEFGLFLKNEVQI